MAHTKFHLGYFTKFGATSWPGDGKEFGSQWADGSYHKELDTRNNRDFGGAIIQFVGAG